MSDFPSNALDPPEPSPEGDGSAITNGPETPEAQAAQQEQQTGAERQDLGDSEGRLDEPSGHDPDQWQVALTDHTFNGLPPTGMVPESDAPQREAWCCAYPLLAGRTQCQDTFVQAKMIVDELLVLQHSDVPKNNQHGGSARTKSGRRSQCGSRSQGRRVKELL